MRRSSVPLVPSSACQRSIRSASAIVSDSARRISRDRSPASRTACCGSSTKSACRSRQRCWNSADRCALSRPWEFVLAAGLPAGSAAAGAGATSAGVRSTSRAGLSAGVSISRAGRSADFSADSPAALSAFPSAAGVVGAGASAARAANAGAADEDARPVDAGDVDDGEDVGAENADEDGEPDDDGGGAVDAGAVGDGEDAGNADGAGDPDGGGAGGAVDDVDFGEDAGAENAV